MNKSELVTGLNTKGRVYLASPFFNDAQLERVEAVKSMLESHGLNVFSPKDENFVSPDAKADWRQVAFQGNVNAINDASFILAITDGLDAGTLFEAGHAYSSDIPIVYFAETLGDNQFNLMLAQSGNDVVTSRDELDKHLSDPKFYEYLLNNQVYTKYDGTIE